MKKVDGQGECSVRDLHLSGFELAREVHVTGHDGWRAEDMKMSEKPVEASECHVVPPNG